MKRNTWKILVVVAVLAAGWYFSLSRHASSPTYRNEQYGLAVSLPDSWRGYTVVTDQWEGRDVATGAVAAHGPLIKLRHPQWTAQAPREDLPVMVFTPTQWDLIRQEKMSVGAAPIPPSELARNSKYIIALPARYNYDYKTGWEEVQTIIDAKSVSAF